MSGLARANLQRTASDAVYREEVALPRLIFLGLHRHISSTTLRKTLEQLIYYLVIQLCTEGYSTFPESTQMGRRNASRLAVDMWELNEQIRGPRGIICSFSSPKIHC